MTELAYVRDSKSWFCGFDSHREHNLKGILIMGNLNEQVTIIEGLTWPIADVSSFSGQKSELNSHTEVMKYVSNRTVLVQAGGNCGMVLNTFVQYFDTVYTFEPDTINFYCLNQNVTDSRVIKIQGCLGNAATPVNLQMREGLSDIGSFYVSGLGKVPVFKLDDLHLYDCGMIFLDVEGYEHNALLGSINTIEKYKPAIFLETEEAWLNVQNTTTERLTAFLISLGYKKIVDIGTNVLWIHSSKT